MPAVYLGFGSNIGDRKKNIDCAIGYISEIPGVSLTKVSSIYETSPVGYIDQPDFLNAVAEINTEMNPTDILHKILEIENKMGRKRNIRWGPRVIDIDILLYDNIHIEEPDLIIPHPRMNERAFVIVPLAEIAPDLKIGDNITVSEMCSRLGDQNVRKADDK